MARIVTRLDHVNAVAEHARSEAEVIATIVCMVDRFSAASEDRS
jgi:hypothetical protein